MKKIFTVLNCILLVIALAGCVYYDKHGGNVLKGITSGWFVLLGGVNLVYSLLRRVVPARFSVLMFLGLFFCMLGDVMLGPNFIIGVLLFMLGHLFYFFAYCAICPFSRKDLLPIGVIFAVSVGVLLLPIFRFEPALLRWACMFYGLVISCMAGKAAANYWKERTLPNLLLVIGSVMFYLSDLMLVLNFFADAPAITATLCLYLYWPGQTLLAHTVFHHANRSSR